MDVDVNLAPYQNTKTTEKLHASYYQLSERSYRVFITRDLEIFCGNGHSKVCKSYCSQCPLCSMHFASCWIFSPILFSHPFFPNLPTIPYIQYRSCRFDIFTSLLLPRFLQTPPRRYRTTVPPKIREDVVGLRQLYRQKQ